MGKGIDLGLAGPDNPIYKGGLRVSSVLGSSELIKNSPTNTDGASSSAQDDSMVPAMDALEAELQSRLQPQKPEMTLEEEKKDGAVRLARLMGRRPTAEELKYHREG